LKRILDIIFWIGLAAYFLIAMSFVSARQGGIVCTSVEACILDSLHSRFVTVRDILRVADHPTRKLRGKLLDSIHAAKLEEQLVQMPPVLHAEVYKTADGTVHVDVTQRTPVLRIINRYGESYYLDESGQALRHADRYSVHVLVANGHIDRRAPDSKGFRVLHASPTNGKRDIIRELFRLALWMKDNRFWNAQIQQIYVNADGDIELIPRVGSHVILFGKGDRIDEKFAKLEALYRNGLNVAGWNRYDAINLKYDGQIVCTKREQ
jgi:cell division protein FtsQ